MAKKYREFKCTVCGKAFKSTGTHAQFCPECRPGIKAERTREYNRTCWDVKKRKERKKRVLAEIQSINEVMRELEKYNKSHGTCYTYGQYTALKFSGRT